MSDIYPIKRKSQYNSTAVEYDLNLVREYCRENKKIALIKDYRMLSGLGLKQSKDAVESHDWNEEALVEDFIQYLEYTPEPYTKEEFMHTIERAIDSMEDMHFTDMIDAVEIALRNIKEKGGLDALARERDEFLRKI